MSTTHKPVRWIDVDLVDAAPGDMATYKWPDKTLDAREVTRFNADKTSVWIDIMGTEAGPYPTEQYAFSRLFEPKEG